MAPLFSAVLTTIQPPTASVRRLAARLEAAGARLVVAGDRKGPERFDLPGVEFLGLAAQLESPFELARKLPTGHYARKNVGYLHAIRAGAACIYETDDDNAPLPGWGLREETVAGVREVGACPARAGRWVNVYRYFTGENVWPRGLPLDEIGSAPPTQNGAGPRWSPVQQGLVNGSPDVDALWRLTQDRALDFADVGSVYLGPGNWCPFNTQSTWWWPAAYALLYVPSHCPFRMCDIWRGLVAQRCLWEMGAGVCYHGPEVVQARNAHDLMRDFEDEMPGYLQNKRLASILAGLALRPGSDEVAANLRRCYEALVTEGHFPGDELELVDAWVADVVRSSCAAGVDGACAAVPPAG